MKTRQAAILCGGLGSRLGALTAETPKPLLTVGGEPFLKILLQEVGRYGVDRFLLLAAHQAEQVKQFARDVKGQLTPGIEINVSVEPERAGTGGAVLHAAAELEDRFFLLNGDSLLDELALDELDRMLEEDKSTVGVMVTRQIEAAGRYGVVKMESDSKVTTFSPSSGASGPALINGGVYAFKRDVINAISPVSSLEQDVLPRLAHSGRLQATVSSGYFIDIGVPADFERAQHEVTAQRLRPAAILDARWLADEADWAAAGAAIRRLNDARWYVFVVGVPSALHRLRRRFLQETGARLDDEQPIENARQGLVAAWEALSRRWPLRPGAPLVWTPNVAIDFVLA